MIDWKQFWAGLIPTLVILASLIALVALVWAVASLSWTLGLVLLVVCLIPFAILLLLFKGCLVELSYILWGEQ